MIQFRNPYELDGNLLQLSNLKVSRCYKPEGFGEVKSVELHNFSDASKDAYGRCSSLRLINHSGQIHCSLVKTKSQVALLKPVTPVPPKVWKQYVDDSFCFIKRNTIDSFHNTLKAIDQQISFTIENEYSKQIAFLDSLVTRKDNALIIDVYRNQPIPTGIWISSPTMTNDTRSVQLRLYYITQLNCRAQNKEKRLKLIMSPMLYVLTITLKISSPTF